MDLASFAGGDYLDVVLDGESFRVGELRFEDWVPVQAWIKATVPGPLSVLSGPSFESLPAGEQAAVRRLAVEAERSWPPRIGSLDWFKALDNPGGHAVFLRAILARHQPGITPGRCAELAARLLLGEVAPLVAAGLGLFDPKAGPRPATKKPRRKAGPDRRATTPGKSSAGSASPTGGRRRKPSA